MSAKIDFCLLESVVLFCAKMDTVNRNKQKKNVLCDWRLPPVFRFVVPSRISCGAMQKTCCICVCVYARDRLLPLANTWTVVLGVLCMDQSQGPTQPGVDDSCVAIGLLGHHRRGGLYLSFILMFQIFFMCPAPHFFLQLSKDFSFSHDLLFLHGLDPLMKLRCKINN